MAHLASSDENHVRLITAVMLEDYLLTNRKGTKYTKEEKKEEYR